MTEPRDPTLPAYQVLLFARTVDGGLQHKGTVTVTRLNDARDIADRWMTSRAQPAGDRYAAIMESRLVERVGPEVIDLGPEGLAMARALANLGEGSVPEEEPHA